MAISIAYLSNMAFKFGLVVVVGGGALARLTAPGMLAVALGMGGVLLLGIAV